MAGPLSRIARRGRVVQWAALYEAAKVIYGHGRRMYRNLSPAERERLGQLDRVAGVAKADEVGALDDPASVDVEAGDDALENH